jgi:hypothetical protein
MTKAGYLVQQYGAQDIYWTIPYNRGLKRADHNIASIDDKSLVISRVQTHTIAAQVLQQVNTFFGFKKIANSDFYAEKKEGEILLRV